MITRPLSSSPVTRGVMEALEGLKVVMRPGVGYDVIDVEARFHA